MKLSDVTLNELRERRRISWRQTGAMKIPDDEAAIPMIERLGVVTLYNVSPELPSLYSAYMGEPDPPMFEKHDSPSGRVYSWRWSLGRREAAFYTAIVRKRQTWVRWDLLPAILRLYDGADDPGEVAGSGTISADAARIVAALDDNGGVLTTGELRLAAGFPKGKASRASFLRAVEELDARLLLAKVFVESDDGAGVDMAHALVAVRYPDAFREARNLSREASMLRFLESYLPGAVYALPVPLARHLRLSETALRAGFDRMAAHGSASAIELPEVRGTVYLAAGEPS